LVDILLGDRSLTIKKAALWTPAIEKPIKFSKFIACLLELRAINDTLIPKLLNSCWSSLWEKSTKSGYA